MRREFQRLAAHDVNHVAPAQFNEENYFALFGLPAHFAVDTGLLRERFHELQRALHPDRYARATEAERRASVLLAARVNDAYGMLRNPLERARYLLRLQGIDIAELDRARPPDAFLQMQLEWRESLDEARATRDRQTLFGLTSRVLDATDHRYDELAAALAQQRCADATLLATELQFLERLNTTIAAAIDDMDIR